MYDLIQMLILGFVIGLTGALAPGPTLVATINASIGGNWTTGLKVSLGHLIVELVLVILILFGLAAVALPYTSAIAGIGGIALIVFGGLTIAGSRKATMCNTPVQSFTNPYMAGLVTSAANPYFWIWWLSIGSAMVLAGLQGGVLLVGIFMIGHWSADTVWFTLVSTGVSKGSTIFPDSAYRKIIALCGIFLILFGIFYLSCLLISS
ncbi:MAG: LysE family translocator [Methanoregula sp.]|jgi:threonine/homoserine/homoserine lactone efflux protein|nr:LysE family translocator [Methanoregula sp.]